MATIVTALHEEENVKSVTKSDIMLKYVDREHHFERSYEEPIMSHPEKRRKFGNVRAIVTGGNLEQDNPESFIFHIGDVWRSINISPN